MPMAGKIVAVLLCMMLAACEDATKIPALALPSLTFSATPESVTAGGTATLSWNAENATACSASGAWDGDKEISGSQVLLSLTSSGTYTLSCSGPGGNVSQSTTVTVQPPSVPSITLSAAPFTRVTIEDGQAPWGKNLADIDGDGFLDIIEGGGNLGGNIYWYRYPAWSKSQIGSVGGDDDLRVGDINGDGAVDIVVNGGIYWYENPRGSGGAPANLWTRHTIDADNNTHDLVLGDINNDSKLDVVTRGEFGPTTLYLQTSPDVWTKISMPNALNGEGTALGDIDRDGRIDIVANGYWLQQPADPVAGSWVRRYFATWAAGAAVVIEDINNDGRLDIFLSISESGAGTLAWFEAPADPIDGTWIRHDIGNVEDVHKFHIADMNKDGKPDVVFAEMHQAPVHRVGVFYNHGSGAAWTLQTLATTGSHNIAVGDVERDGDIDILGANWATNSPDGGGLNLWRNDLNENLALNQWQYIQVDTAKTDRSFGLNFGDLDRDGKQDIVAGRYWYRNSGGDLTGGWTRTDFGAGLDAMLILDVDGDGRLDVIAEGAASNGVVPVYWLKPTNAAGTTWSQLQVGTIPADPADGTSQGYATAQLGGNAKPEIILSSSGIHYFQIPASPAAGNWPQVQVAADAREEGIAAGDIDGDGDLDIVGLLAPAGTTISWWENPGNGAAGWTRHNLGTSAVEGDRIALADINGDGKLDVVLSETNLGSSGNALYWFAQPASATNSNWPRTTIASNAGSLNSMDVADFNGDGKPDVVSGEHRGALAVTIYKNNGNGATWTAQQVSQGRESHLGARTADLDGDGDTDIVSIAYDANAVVHLWRNNAKP